MSYTLALCQMKISDNKQINLNKAEQLFNEAVLGGADVIVFPEMFNCPYSNKYFQPFSETDEGETVRTLSRLAKAKGKIIVGGSIPEREGDNIYNTSFVLDENGQIIAKHRKVHLFDVDIKDGVRFKESDTLAAGDKVTVADTTKGRIGIGICYDIRFPELSRLMALEGVDLIVFPAVFAQKTGEVHWEMLLRARAVDNQVYFAGAAPARDHASKSPCFAHSMIVDPWGEVIARAGIEESIIYADIDTERIKNIRQQLPLLAHRRTDLYKLEIK